MCGFGSITPFGGHGHGDDVAILIKFHSINAEKARVADRDGGLVAVVHDEVLIILGKVEVAVMAGTAGDLTVSRGENGSSPAEGTPGCIGGAVVDPIGAVGPVPGGPHEIVDAVALEHTGRLYVVGGRDLAEGDSVIEGHESCHISVHAADIAVPPAAVIEIDRPIVVLEQVGVNGLGPVVELADEGMIQKGFEGTDGRVRDGDLQASHLAHVGNVVGGENVVEFSVDLLHGRSPDGALDVREPTHVDDILMQLPVGQIL